MNDPEEHPSASISVGASRFRERRAVSAEQRLAERAAAERDHPCPPPTPGQAGTWDEAAQQFLSLGLQGSTFPRHLKVAGLTNARSPAEKREPL